MTGPLSSVLKFIAILGLVVSVASGVSVLTGAISHGTYNLLMVLGMLMWFGSAVFWIKSQPLGE
ncbi:hypothetical protein [Aeoliella sp.]|uniref:hypothetical protein n=1 Tax=Aeoliella sp. TaxID=2795800 RepID=UPI003CCB9FF4